MSRKNAPQKVESQDHAHDDHQCSHDHGDAHAVRSLDQLLQGVGAAVGGLDGEDVGRVVAPAAIAGLVITSEITGPALT